MEDEGGFFSDVVGWFLFVILPALSFLSGYLGN